MTDTAAPVAERHRERLRAFLKDGYTVFGPDEPTRAWAAAARPLAERIARDPAETERWLRCAGTWFAGVNVFPNGPEGSVPEAGIPPLAGAAVTFLAEALGIALGPDGAGRLSLEPAQISVCYPGYPAAPMAGESEAAFRFRRNRDGAHVDGLQRDAQRRRNIGEAHAFLLGLPLAPAPPGGAPFVVWQGSHHLVREALAARLAGLAPEAWPAEDVTEAYTAVRRRIFDECPRIALTAPPGGAYLVHRLALHGMAPWPEGVAGAPARMIAYFRPELPGRDFATWLAPDPAP
ncbi:MAG: hypothetical protein AAF074_19565 [Pseudomonadota bacterium]